MRRAIMIVAVGALGVGACSDSAIAPTRDDQAGQPSYGTVASPYLDLGYQPPATLPHGIALAPGPSNGNAVLNASFEVNDGPASPVFADWGQYNDGDGAFFAQVGTEAPITGSPVPAPPDADFAAMADQFGPGTHILFQDVVVPRGATLGFDLYIGNRAGIFESPNTLDNTVFPNQQFRMDIMDPTAPLDDVGAGVLANVYQTMPGDPPESGYDRIEYDLSAFEGLTVRLRFAEVDNLGNFQVGIDDVLVGKASRRSNSNGVVHRATGSGHLVSGDAQRIFTFAAVEKADGSVSGQFTLVLGTPIFGSENPQLTRVQGEVVCLETSGNRAWVGGIVKSTTNPSWVGGEVAFAVEDNGEGRPSPDLISLLNVPNPNPGYAEFFCSNRIPTPNVSIEAGNVQVR